MIFRNRFRHKIITLQIASRCIDFPRKIRSFRSICILHNTFRFRINIYTLFSHIIPGIKRRRDTRAEREAKSHEYLFVLGCGEATHVAAHCSYNKWRPVTLARIIHMYYILYCVRWLIHKARHVVLFRVKVARENSTYDEDPAIYERLFRISDAIFLIVFVRIFFSMRCVT